MGSTNTISEKRGILSNIKSKIIIKEIFKNIKEIKLLKIIRHNKKLHSQLNKDINNYKKFSYIEIEIYLNSKENGCGKFINISNEQYFHIYFNNNDEEIKRDIIYKNEGVKKIKVIIDHKIKSLRGLFGGCGCIYKIKFIRCNREDKIDISHMFDGCNSLKILDLSNFNVINLINVKHLLYGCNSLNKLYYPKLNKKNIITISYIFLEYQKLRNPIFFKVIDDKFALILILCILFILIVFFTKIFFFVVLIVSLF